MKKFVILLCIIALICSLTGCGNYTSQTPVEEKEPAAASPSTSDENYSETTQSIPVKNSAPVNYMDEIKEEIHDELFREETSETLDIINRIFKHLDIEVLDAFVNGDEAVVLMSVTTINAGQAWINGLEKYAIECASNLFSDTYADDDMLYQYYLEEFEDAVREAKYIKIPVAVEMDYRNHRWIWDIDDDVINAITGFMLAAIDGDINSATPFTLAWLDDDLFDNFDLKIELDPINPWSFVFEY